MEDRVMDVEKTNEHEDYIEDLSEQIRDAKKKVTKRTLTVEELGRALNISKYKARELTMIDGFPVIVLGRDRLTLKSKLDGWLEDNIGRIF